MSEYKPQIKVFVTKSRKFRAKIKETKDGIPYEVTIGGENWKKDVGRKYEYEIKHKIIYLMMDLESKYKEIWKI